MLLLQVLEILLKKIHNCMKIHQYVLSSVCLQDEAENNASFFCCV